MPVQVDRPVGPQRDAAVGMRRVFALRVPVDAVLGKCAAQELRHRGQRAAQHGLADLAQQLQAAQRCVLGRRAKVEIVHRQGFREARGVALEGVHGHQGRGVVRHVVAADHVAAVGQTLRMAVVGRAQQQRCGVDGASAQYKTVRRDALAHAILDDLGSDDAFAAVVGDQPLDPHAGAQLDVVLGQRRADQPHLGVALCADLARHRVAVGAALTAPAGAKVDCAGHREGRQALGAQPLFDGRQNRLMRDGGMRVRGAARRIGGVDPTLAAHAKQLLGLAVPRLQIGIADRPGG